MNFCLNGRAERPDDVCLLDDLRAFSLLCGGRCFSYGEYKLAGRFYPSIYVRRFGSWNRALVLAGLQPKKLFNVGADVLLENLRRLWCALGRQPTMADLIRPLSGFGRKPYVRVFGSWSSALRCAALESGCGEQGAGMVSDGSGCCGQHHLPLAGLGYSSSAEEENGCLAHGAALKSGCVERRMGMVSEGSGYCGQHHLPLAALGYSSSAEEENGCLAHGAALESGVPPSREATADKGGEWGTGVPPSPKAMADERKTVGWRVRYLVMKRDSYRCVLCGASPALEPGVVLHVDHIVPQSKGGSSNIDNLQTLCEVCNGGKGNLI